MTICRLSALGISSIPFVEQLKSFSVKQVRDVILKYDESLKSYCENLNSLNVYPVPDGDTGTNMSFTLKSVIEELDGNDCLLYTSPSPRDRQKSRMPSSA